MQSVINCRCTKFETLYLLYSSGAIYQYNFNLIAEGDNKYMRGEDAPHGIFTVYHNIFVTMYFRD